MKCPALLLLLGVLLPSFYLECKAFKYHEARHNDRSPLLGAERTLDHVRHHRSRRNLDPGLEGKITNETDCKNASVHCTEVQANHRYYVSKIVPNGKEYWRDIQGNPKVVEHPFLSDSYLLRQNLDLSFQFPYYGHLLSKVMLTTGGFLYMDVHDTKLMTEVQYLAPLMAYFNPHLSRESKVFSLDDGEKLTVEWYKVLLHINTTFGPFTFQCTLHKNGSIWFAYKEIPVQVEMISSLTYHPVKVGISDAFVIRYKDNQRNILYRYFYIYSTINITMARVVSNAAVIFKPQLSCVDATSCTQCVERTAETNFTCQFCPQTQRCSDGVDRHREEWENAKCSDNAIKEMSEACLRDGVARKRKSKDKGIGGGAIFAICLVLVLVIGVAAWCVYAYRHPTSKSGLFFIEATRRPRGLFKRSSDDGGSTGHAAPSDVKPQVL